MKKLLHQFLIKTISEVSVRKRIRMLLLKRALWGIALLFCQATIVFADDMNAGMITFSESNSANIQRGYIEVKVPIYDDNANDEWVTNGIIRLNGVDQVKFKTKSQGNANWYWANIYTTGNCLYAETTVTHDNDGFIANQTYQITSNSSKSYAFKKEGSTTYAVLRIYPQVSMLKSGKDINIQAYIYYEGTATSGSKSIEKTSTVKFQMPDTPAMSYDFSLNPGNQCVRFNGTADDKYRITDKGETAISATGNISIDYPIQNENKNIELIYYKKISNHQFIDVNTTCQLPAYQHPEDFKATLLPSGDVEITWSVNNVVGAVEGDNFEVQRSDDINFATAKTVGTLSFASSKKYELKDRTSLENLNGTYYYRLRRTKAGSWGWNYTKNANLLLEMTHLYIGAAEANMIDDNHVQIRWDYDRGNVLSDNSDIMLKRTNEMKGTSEIYAIPRDSVDAGRYTELLMTTCDVYSYMIYLKPGNSNYHQQEALKVASTEKLYTAEMGRVTQLNVSKGYFSERVALDWETDGKTVDVFSIRARKHNSGEPFKQIDQVDGNVASSKYQYSDTKSIPGIIYDYQVVSIASCGDESRMIESDMEIGFRTPTGDIYGRITFENGQSVENVEVRAEMSDPTMKMSKSYWFNGSHTLDITNTNLLDNLSEITFQTWLKPEDLQGSVFAKGGMVEVALENGYPVLQAGNQRLTSDSSILSAIENGMYVHLTTVVGKDSLVIYLNGKKVAAENRTAKIVANQNPIILGQGYRGNLDEVRIWSAALTEAELNRDFQRYLTGGEKNLIAYYTFDYGVDGQFYDRSYKGTFYNENHGVGSAVIDDVNIPSEEQLGYKSITGADGSYSLLSIPYIGNGTAYSLIPRMGIHQFEPQREVRFINAFAQSHTVNFTDNSSFNVSGYVTYDQSTIPVEGVSFLIDGVTAVSGNGTILQSDATGAFSIMVPVGIHEVKAVKNNHVFINGGRITNSDGTDRNYQDRISSIELYDVTTVDYVGRVAGGTIQEAYPLGHGLSVNNLADSIKVVLAYENEAYQIAKTPYGTFEKHFKPSNKAIADSNYVSYQRNEIVIDVHPVTGEFRASVIPESFKVRVNAPYYGDMIAGNGSVLNLSNAFIKETVLYEYTDSTLVNGNWIYQNYSDTTSFNKGQKFIARVKPEIRIVQVDHSGKELNYFGEPETFGIEQNGDKATLSLVDDQKSGMSKYVFGMPFFAQNTNYSLRATIFEGYTYRNQAGSPKEEVAQDCVPSQDARVRFKATMYQNDPEEVEANENGVAEYTFTCSKIELTSATASLTATASVGDPATATSFNWDGETNKVVVLGSESTGTNFVTAGPNKLLTVLRDPPGTNSYAFLEKGASFKETSAYTGNVTNTGSESLTQKLGTELVTFTGIGVGTIQSATTSTGFTVGVNHEESVGGTNAKESVTTTTTRFQTSDDPLYVGAIGDVYVGYSTNIVFGEANSINFVSRKKLESVGVENIGSIYPAIYEDITPQDDSEWVLVQQKTLSVGQHFSTLFAYPQVHIENVLIPNLEMIRNQIFRFATEKSPAEFQAEAELKGEPIVVSYLTMDDKNFGLSNADKAFNQEVNPNQNDLFDGPSYRIFFPDAQEIRKDTIDYMNQSIQAWIDQMAANEKAKKEAQLIQNYSFHAGSPIEYSESYTNTTTKSQTFNLSLGFNFKNDTDVNLFGTGFSLAIDETVTTEHGGEFSTEDEKSHSKGFVLAEDGDDDYLSVDVCYERGRDSDGNEIENNQYSSFIFRTKGGVTSCPYEGEYVTKYFEPGQHILNVATMQIEVPRIAVEKDFIENVPSGKPAYLTVYLRNNSEVQQEVWYDLKVDDTSNPNGARFSMDGGAIGNGRAVMLPAGETLVKTIEVSKGSVMNYDDLKLILISQCQGDPTTFIDVIADTVSFSVHFTPSCTDVNIAKPGNNWTYNTKLPTITEEGVKKHYMEVVMDGFDVNYDNFNRIKLQYKPASASDDQWTTIMNYYNDSTLYRSAIDRNENAEMILASNAGKIKHNWMIDNLPDQRYDLRAVSICIINNEEIESVSESRSGIKDMYLPRLFGSAQPANGILTINDEIRLNFNEQIADGYLTRNNFQVTGIRNGSKTDHSVSLTFDGINDVLKSAHVRNWENKDITVEMWVRTDQAQNAVFFSQGNNNNPLELGVTSDNRLKVRIGTKELVSEDRVPFEKGSWAHVALSVSKEGLVTAYYNFIPYLTEVRTNQYPGEGKWMFGGSLFTAGKNFGGQMHNARIWNKVLTSGRLQTNSLTILSGAESGLLAYYPMNEAKGSVVNDKAQGMHLTVNGAEWTLPAGYGVSFNGTDQYLTVSTGSSAVIDGSMDATIEFWFKGGAENANAALLTNGRGDGTDAGGSYNLFAIGFENSILTFRNNEAAVEVAGDYLDNNWHHFALSINRNTGRSQVLVDGLLKTYFESADLGSIASDRMVLGARSWYDENDITTPVVDRFFNGSMDELRIWNHYKNSTLIEKGAFEKLSGNEKGLLAYYPFETYIEWQGVQELQFSLADKKQQADPTLQVPDAIVSGGNMETADKAPVRDCGPVENLQYSFVVNNDALIISLNEPWENVEKTTVSFTVEGVLDVNGNEIASPVTWSAYIDRNQLRWTNDEIYIEKDVYEARSFTVDIKNHGGAVENYVIENMPYWLSVSPVSGSVNPTSSQKITFVIDEALNIGTYNEVIYLRNDYNVMESLAINVKVNGEKPDWLVNPKEFKYNMNVFGKIRINSIFSDDEEDMLAAFIGGKCVGVTTNMYHKAGDMWYAYLTVYSNDPVNEQVEFRIWDASTGKVYFAVSDEKIGFKNNDVIGTASTPVIFDTKEMIYQNISLESGWNWISFQVNNGMLGDVNAVLSNNTWMPGDIVKSETNGFDSYSKRLGWVGTLTDNGGFDNTSMFMLKTSEDKVLSVSGAHVEMDQHPIVVLGKTASDIKRWSYIAYLPSVNQSLNEALSGYDAVEGDVIKSQDAFAMYAENLGWIGNLTFMEPGKGYMLQRNEQHDVMLKYAQTGSPRQMIRRSGIATQYTGGYTNRTYAGNMNVVATVEAGFELMEGDKIQAYVDGELRGESAVTAGSESGAPLFFLNVAGEQAGTLNFCVVRDNKPVAQSVNTLTYVNHLVAGSVNEPVQLRFREETFAGVYPNPFAEELNIVLEAAAGDRAEVVISDVIGNLMYRYAESVQYDGQIHLLWDQAGSCLPGIYVVKITVRDTVRVYKVEKK